MEAQSAAAPTGAEHRRLNPRWGAGFWAAVVGTAVVAAAVAAVGAGAWWIAALGPAPLGRDLAFSTTVVDRDGRLLRPYATDTGRWRLPARSDSVDPRYLELLIAYEDKRFRAHAGADPLALLRAGGQFLAHGRILSGGSTLTMQVARLLEPRGERSFAAKLRQIVRAFEIERHLSKDEVLALYLSLAPYGGNLEGIRAAALAYFGKEPKRLTLGEAALLVALPQAPEARRPDRFAVAARRARDRVLDRVATAGIFDAEEIFHAKAEPVPAGRQPMPMLAPHAADDAVAALPGRSRIQFTIDGPWQASLEELARERAKTLGPDISVAILAVEHATGDVLARVGSADYFDARRAGQVDMTAALRSPGSTLKPFIYGLGFEDGVIHPETLIEDRPVRYGAYAPENFDLTFQGTVPVRKALQMSLNVPAVAVLDRVGAGRFAARLRQAGGALVLPKGEAPGLAMGLGGVGVRLSDLVMLYAGLARLGTTVPLRILRETNNAFAVPVVPSPACGGGSGRGELESDEFLDPHHCTLPPPQPSPATGGGSDSAGCAAADGAGRGLVCGQHSVRHAAAGTCARRAHRVQDRHQLRLPGCLVGRLRRQAHHRGVGRAARRCTGAGAHRPHRRGADPVRCLRALGQIAGRAAGAAARCAVRQQCQAAAAAAALPPRRPRRRRSRGERRTAAAHLVPAQRCPARTGRRPAGDRSAGAENRRRRHAADRAGQRQPARRRFGAAYRVLHPRRPRIPAPHRDGRQRRHRQRDGAAGVGIRCGPERIESP